MLKTKVLRNLSKSLENVTEIGKEAVEDKDATVQAQLRLAELLLTGKGASITKITICVCVGWLVGVGSYGYLIKPEMIPAFKGLCRAVTPLLSVLIGMFGTGKMFQKSKFSKDE